MKKTLDTAKYEIAARTHGVVQWLASKLTPRLLEREPPAIFAQLAREQQRPLFAAALGGLSFELLRTGYNVGLFRLLHERPGLTLGDIAEALSLKQYPTEIMLLGLVPLKLIDKIGDRYYNNPFLSLSLAGEFDDGAVGKILEFFHHVINPAAAHLQESVVQNKPVGFERLFGADAGGFYQAIAKDSSRGEIFAKAMQADTRFNRDLVAGNKLFSQSARILDVGGNIGELALAIAKRHPQARVTVFDLPEVASRAAERARSEGLSDRVDAVSGDFLEQGFPGGYDCVLFSHFLDIFSPTRVKQFLGHAHRALDPGGAVCVFGAVVDDDEGGPIEHGALSAYFLCLAGGEGRFYSARQTAAAMSEAGFSDVTTERLPRNEALVIGRKR